MIIVEYKKPYFLLGFQFNKTDLTVVQNLPIREFIKSDKVWRVHELAAQSLDILPDDTIWLSEATQRYELINKSILSLIDYKFSENGTNKNPILRPYQKIGVNFLVHAKSGLLADDLGLGKTITTIEALRALGGKTNLILCPATLKLNWANEFKKHTTITPLIIDGNADIRKELWATLNPYKIANYDLLLRDWLVMPHEWDGIVADECVALKSHAAKRTKLVKKLKSNVRIGLSGIPIEINLMEFHSIMEWIRPEVIPSYPRFKSRYIVVGWDGKPVRYKNLFELHKLTSPFILRRTKEQVLKELPPKTITEVPLGITEPTRRAYQAIQSDFITWLREVTDKNWGSSILEKLIRLRQFVEFPQIVGFNMESVKLNWLDDLYTLTNKLAVFCCFRESVRIITQHFNTPYVLTGDTPINDRVPLIEKFNGEYKALLVMTDAAKFGLNITGADNLVHFGYPYNPAVVEQREGRLHRIGQNNVVNVFKPYIVDTIDEGILSILGVRAHDAQSFMRGSDVASIVRLSKDEWEKITIGSLKLFSNRNNIP